VVQEGAAEGGGRGQEEVAGVMGGVPPWLKPCLDHHAIIETPKPKPKVHKARTPLQPCLIIIPSFNSSPFITGCYLGLGGVLGEVLEELRELLLVDQLHLLQAVHVPVAHRRHLTRFRERRAVVHGETKIVMLGRVCCFLHRHQVTK
jgi:hypothetical protein